jgi:hypothetical protein
MKDVKIRLEKAKAGEHELLCFSIDGHDVVRHFVSPQDAVAIREYLDRVGGYEAETVRLTERLRRVSVDRDAARAELKRLWQEQEARVLSEEE